MIKCVAASRPGSSIGMHVLFFKRMLLPGRVLLPGIHQNKSKCNKCKLKGTPQYMRGFTSRANEMRCRRP